MSTFSSIQKALQQREAERMQQTKLTADQEFFDRWRTEDIGSNMDKYTESLLDSMQNLSLYRKMGENFNVRTYAELGIDPTIGQSVYDKNATNLLQMRNLGDVRAQSQPAPVKLLNGIAGAFSMAVSTAIFPATVFSSVGFGIAGAKEAEDEKLAAFAHSFLDNPVTRMFQDLDETVSRLAPIYRFEEERDESLSLPKRMGYAGFWAEDFVKNLGFTVGAMYGGKFSSLAIDNGLKWLGKQAGNVAAKVENPMLKKTFDFFHDKIDKTSAKAITSKIANGESVDDFVKRISDVNTNATVRDRAIMDEIIRAQNKTNAVGAAFGLVSGAFVEAHTEALQAKKNMVDSGMEFLNQMYGTDSYYARMEFDNAIRHGDIPRDMPYDEFRRQKLQKGAELLENRANSVMSHTFLLESALLTATNAALWRDWFNTGFRDTSRRLYEQNQPFYAAGARADKGFWRFLKKPKADANGKINIKDITEKKNRLSKAWQYIERVGGESFEEMAQSGITTALEAYYGSKMNDDYRMNKIAMNPDYAKYVLSGWEAFTKHGLGEGMFSWQGISEGFIGGLTGALGLPKRKLTRSQRKQAKMSIFNPKAWEMQGGIWEAFRRNKEDAKQAADIVANIQETFKDGTDLDYIITNYSAIKALEHVEAIGYANNNKKEVLDAQREMYVKALNIYNKLGMMNDVEEIYRKRSSENLGYESEEEMNNALVAIYKQNVSDKDAIPTPSDIAKMKSQMLKNNKRKLDLLTVYKDLENNLFALANFNNYNNMSGEAKMVVVDMLKSMYVRLDDLKARNKELYDDFRVDFQNVLAKKESLNEKTDKEDILYFAQHLEKYFPNINSILNSSYKADDEKEISYDDLYSEVLDDVVKYFDDNTEVGGLDVEQRAFVFGTVRENAAKLIDYYRNFKEIESVSKKIARGVMGFVQDVNDIQKDIADDKKKASVKEAQAIVDKLEDIFKDRLSKSKHDYDASETFNEVKKLIEELRSLDPVAADAYVQWPYQNKGGNPRKRFFLYNYNWDNRKIRDIHQDKTLQMYSDTDVYKQLVETMPSNIKNVIDEFLKDPNLEQPIRDAVAALKSNIQSRLYYYKDISYLLSASETKKSNSKNDGEVPVRVRKNKKAKTESKKPEAESGELEDDGLEEDDDYAEDKADYEVLGRFADEPAKKLDPANPLFKPALFNLYNIIKGFDESMENAEDRKGLEYNADELTSKGILKVTFDSKESLDMKGQNTRVYSYEYIYNFCINQVSIKASKEDKVIFETSVPFTDLNFISDPRHNDYKSRYTDNSELIIEEGRFKRLKNRDNLPGSIKKSLDEIKNEFTGDDASVLNRFLFSVNSNSSFGTLLCGIIVPNMESSAIGRQDKVAINDMIGKLHSVFDTFVAAYNTKNKSNTPKEEKDNSNKGKSGKDGKGGKPKEQAAAPNEIIYSKQDKAKLASMQVLFEPIDPNNPEKQNVPYSLEDLVNKSTLNDILALVEDENASPQDRANMLKQLRDKINDIGFDFDVDDSVELNEITEIPDIIFQNNNFTATSLTSAYGSFPIGYEFRYWDDRIYNIDLRVTKIDGNGKVIEAESDDHILTRSNGSFIVEAKREVSKNEKTAAQSQRSTTQISEYLTDINGSEAEHPVRPTSTETWKKHPGYYNAVQPLHDEAYDNIGRGIFDEGDTVYFELQDVNLAGKDREWIDKSASQTLVAGKLNGRIIVAKVRKNGNEYIAGVISPTVKGYTSQLYYAILGSYNEETDSLEAIYQIKEISRAYERVFHEPNVKPTQDLFGPYSDSMYIQVTNDGINSTGNKVENADIDGLNIRNGNIYLVTDSSLGGGKIHGKEGVRNLAAVTVSKDAIPAVVDEYTTEAIEQVLQAENDTDKKEAIERLYHVLNNAFYSDDKGIKPKIAVYGHKTGITFGFVDPEGTMPVFEITEDVNGDMFIGKAMQYLEVNENTTVEDVKDAIKRLLKSSIKVNVQITKHSFYDDEVNLDSNEGVSLRFLHDNGLLMTGAVNNRTANAHIVLDFDPKIGEGEATKRERKSSKSNKKKNSRKAAATTTKKVKTVDTSKKKKPSIFENYKRTNTGTVTHNGTAMEMDVYQNDDTCILHVKDGATADFIKAAEMSDEVRGIISTAIKDGKEVRIAYTTKTGTPKLSNAKEVQAMVERVAESNEKPAETAGEEKVLGKESTTTEITPVDDMSGIDKEAQKEIMRDQIKNWILAKNPNIEEEVFDDIILDSDNFNEETKEETEAAVAAYNSSSYRSMKKFISCHKL